METKYRFSINGVSVSPSFKDDTSKEYALESGQRFFRATISGEWKFMNSDFDWIMNQPYETEFVFLIEKSSDFGITWTNYYEGTFYKTDCTVDLDTGKIETKVETKDQYVEVLAKMDNEYDLIKLGPAKQSLSIVKRPLIQLYVPGSKVVSCFLSGNSWEQEVETEITDLGALVNTYKFALATTVYKWNISGNGTINGSQALLIGDYVAETSQTYYGRNGTYKMAMEVDQSGEIWSVRYTIKRSSDNVLMFDSGWDAYSTNNFVLNAVAGSGASGSVTLYIFDPIKIYMRYLLDVTTIQGLNTYDINPDDFVGDNRNYSRVIGYAIDCVTISPYASTTPTEFGKADDGMYFIEPYTPWGEKFFPIARSTWGYSSIWFSFATFDWIMETQGRKSYVLKDAMFMSDVIKSLLGQLDPTITHEATTDYSQFLYGTTNPITYNYFRIMLTQKSNILAGDYDQPAQKAPITFTSLMNMLRDTMKLYWFIDTNKKFRIEHISWFKNGGSYTDGHVVQTDLTTLLDSKNKKAFAFSSSSYEYDKQDMPERFEFSWMDDVTQGFAGYPIDINSKYVQRGKKEDISVSQYTTDVDYMLMNPGAISMDGFALFAAVKADAVKEYPSYGRLTTSVTGSGECSPKIDLKTGLQGISGVLNILLTFTPGESGTPFFSVRFYKGTTLISSSNEITMTPGTNPYSIPVTIPDCDKFTIMNFYNQGSISVEIQSFKVESFELPFVSRNIDGADLVLQNGFMSWIYLHPNFWTYDLPTTDVDINSEPYYGVQGVQRILKQKVYYPSLEDPDPLQLIKTYFGDGQIEKLSLNLQSRKCDLVLKYDPQ